MRAVLDYMINLCVIIVICLMSVISDHIILSVTGR